MASGKTDEAKGRVEGSRGDSDRRQEVEAQGKGRSIRWEGQAGRREGTEEGGGGYR